jgi:hypothetical protein
MTSPYGAQGSIIVPPHTIRASRPWGKRNTNPNGEVCSPVIITDKQGNTRVVAPLVIGKVVRLNKRTAKVVKGGTRELAPNLTEAQQDDILAQLHANAPKREQAFNIHDK